MVFRVQGCATIYGVQGPGSEDVRTIHGVQGHHATRHGWLVDHPDPITYPSQRWASAVRTSSFSQASVSRPDLITFLTGGRQPFVLLGTSLIYGSVTIIPMEKWSRRKCNARIGG